MKGDYKMVFYRTRVKYVTAIPVDIENISNVEKMLGDKWQGYLHNTESGQITTQFIQDGQTLTAYSTDMIVKTEDGNFSVLTEQIFNSRYTSSSTPLPEVPGESDDDDVQPPQEKPPIEEEILPPMEEIQEQETEG